MTLSTIEKFRNVSTVRRVVRAKTIEKKIIEPIERALSRRFDKILPTETKEEKFVYRRLSTAVAK